MREESELPMSNKITVVDSIMGSGKSTWAINYIEQCKDSVLYVTPFLDEVGRVTNACKNKCLYNPMPKGCRKLENLYDLISMNESIATTHELFKRIDRKGMKLLESKDYVLIIDEALEVVKIFDDIKQDDLKILRDSGCITVDTDGFIIWNEEKNSYDTKYNLVKALSLKRCLVLIDDRAYVWRYPPEIFGMFKQVYVLTYLFDASILRCYFDLYGIKYILKSIGECYHLSDYEVKSGSAYRNLISICEDPVMNYEGEKRTALSVSWYRNRNNKGNIDKLKKHCRKWFRDIKAETILWTTLKEAYPKLKHWGYSSAFIAFNARSTNAYRDRYNLAFVLNVYMNPELKKFFTTKGITVYEDAWALSELLQWIWRSRIRDGQPVNLYLPSSRMRGLLRQWLSGMMPITKTGRAA